VQKNLERYRASVLKAAVEGRLVPTEAELAKKEGRSYEPASELLKRILEERRKKWIENAAEKARAKAEKKAREAGKPWTHADDVKTLEKERPKAAKRYKEPAAPDTTDLPNLPEGWCWATADQLAYSVTDGEHQTPPRTDSGVPLISARNVLNGRLSLEDVDYISKKTHQQLCRRLVVSPGDVLLSCSGTVGRACVAPADVEFSMVRSVAVLMPSLPMGPFMALSLRSPILQTQIHRKKTQTAQANIFQGKIKQLVFPLPSLAEQDCIVESAEMHLGLAARVDKEIAKASARCQRLRQSILNWAFEGKLVEQDPSDEPASALLKQIKAERESMQPRKRRRTNRRKKNEPTKHNGQLDLLGGSDK
jgi:type I restriction enzyme S subunit